MDTSHHNRVTRVTVDDRERWSGVLDVLRARADVRVTVQRLAVGDYLVDGRLLAERKTLVDFGKSVRDQRLFGQMYRLRGSRTERVCLVLEGGPSNLPRMGLSRAAVQGALLVVALSFGVPVLRSRSRAETAELLLLAARQMGRPHPSPRRLQSSRKEPVPLTQRRVLEAIPEVGPVRSEALLTAFGSPAGVAAASEVELARVHGVGPIAAGRVWRALHTPTRADTQGPAREQVREARDQMCCRPGSPD